MNKWTLFSNHGHVLVCLARDSEARLRDVAADVGITERAVQKIIRDLQDGGMVKVIKNGRRNRYRIHKKQSLRHDLEAHCTLSELLNMVIKETASGQSIAAEVKKADHPIVHQPKLRQDKVVPAIMPVSKIRSIDPGAVKLEPEKPAPTEAETDKAKTSDSIERHQGSLF